MSRGRPVAKGLEFELNPATVGGMIRKQRVEKKVGLSDLARALGVSVQFVSNIEHDRSPLPLAYVVNVADILSLDKTTLAKSAFESSNAYKAYADIVRGFTA